MKLRFDRKQLRILIACTLLYTIAYMNRLNLSAALDGIRNITGVSAARVGLLQTCFAVVYAAGQLVHGTVSDRADPKLYMNIGILGSAACNLCIGLCRSFEVTLVCCLVNGAFQSMLWAPIVRVLAAFYPEKEKRTRANFFLSMSLIAGNLAAWGLSAWLSARTDAFAGFTVPALIAIPVVILCDILFGDIRISSRSVPEKDAAKQAEGKRKNGASVPRLLFSGGLIWILLICVGHGFIRDSVTTWAPAILGQTAEKALSGALLIPCVNLFGLILGFIGELRLKNNDRLVLCLFYGLCAAGAAALCLLSGSGMLVTALLLGICCASMHAINPVLTGQIPMEYAGAGRVGLVTGLCDSLIYVGSALAGAVTGWLFENGGPERVYRIFIAVSVLSAAVCLILSRRRRAAGASLS